MFDFGCNLTGNLTASLVCEVSSRSPVQDLQVRPEPQFSHCRVEFNNVFYTLMLPDLKIDDQLRVPDIKF